MYSIVKFILETSRFKNIIKISAFSLNYFYILKCIKNKLNNFILDLYIIPI